MIIPHIQKILRQNSTTILTAVGVSGTLSTAYLAGKASFEASTVIENEQRRLDLNEKSHPLFTKEKLRLVWKLYVPAFASGALTIGCIIWGNRIGTKRTAVAYSLLTVSEKAFTEYREKVVEQLGEKKEKAIRDEIAQDRVNHNAVVVVSGAGRVLCYEMHTDRYFESDIETIRKAVNTVNAQLLREGAASLSDFYYLIGLPPTSYSGKAGWDSDKLLELSFSTTLAQDGRPCITFEYNYIFPF